MWSTVNKNVSTKKKNILITINCSDFARKAAVGNTGVFSGIWCLIQKNMKQFVEIS